MNWPVIPVPPSVVHAGDKITSQWANGVTKCEGDLWTDLQALAVVADAGMKDPTTTLGDLIVRGVSAAERLGVGADGQVLTADAAQALGMAWKTISVASLGAVPSTRKITTGAGLSPGGDLSADLNLAVLDDSTTQRLRFSVSGAPVGTRPELNFIAGTNVTLNVADNPGANRIDVTIGAVGGSSGGGEISVSSNGSPLGTFGALNFKAGTNTAIVVTPNGAQADIAVNVASIPAASITGTIQATQLTSIPAAQISGSIQAAQIQGVNANAIIGQIAYAQIASAPVSAYQNGALISARAGINFVGATVTDDVANNRVTVTVTAGGSQTPWTSDINAAGYKLLSVGRIGVGTATPGSDIDVLGQGAFTKSNSYCLYLRSAVGNPGFLIGAAANGDGQFFDTNGNERMRISQAGMLLLPDGSKINIGNASRFNGDSLVIQGGLMMVTYTTDTEGFTLGPISTNTQVALGYRRLTDASGQNWYNAIRFSFDGRVALGSTAPDVAAGSGSRLALPTDFSVYADNNSAKGGGLHAGEVYRDSGGALRIVF